jgi:hypothetical protein
MCVAALKILIDIPVDTAGEYIKLRHKGIKDLAANPIND